MKSVYALYVSFACLCLMSLLLSWCSMCRCNCESPTHLFVPCPFASNYWRIVLEAFGWSLPCSNLIFDILVSLMVGHPFGGIKRLIWLAILRAFFWALWCEQNVCIFRDFFFSFDRFMDLDLSIAFYWCKDKHPFNHFSLSCLVSNWKCFL